MSNLHKRSRESPITGDETPSKAVKNDIIIDLNDPSAKLLTAFKNIMLEELDDKIEKSVRKSFVEEFDSRLEMMVTKEDFDTLRESIETQKKEKEDLKEKFSKLESRLERIDRNERSSKLVFSKVDCPNGAIGAAYNVCNNILKINSETIGIRNAFIIKKFEDGKSTILVEFYERNMIGIIFKHIKNLQGTKIGIEKDLTEEQQRIRKILVELKWRMLDVSKKLKVHVTETTLKAGSNKFSLKGGVLIASLPGLDVNKFFEENYKINIDEYLKNKC